MDHQKLFDEPFDESPTKVRRPHSTALDAGRQIITTLFGGYT